ncbi:DMT family transporter [Sediminicoccus sp. KRV36]|uniref:DMT family transporter n=1 Tax=Sediminicoccus sp. KRV36 TaxID=3133721 RepID=UPI0020101664|nr:DMT family transporter [Sediminicoccus rosea]UPY35478.1 DMT family transporter [Sediminicoccus rosea]
MQISQKAALPAATRANRRRAVFSILAAAILFALAASCVKALDGAVPLAQLVLFRSLFAFPVLLPLLRQAGGWGALRTTNPMGHAWRTLFGLVGMGGAFYGYSTMPLATVTALGFTMPLFLTLLAVPLLGERVGWRRGSAVVIGFLGVLMMVRPFGAGAAEVVPSLIVLVAALAWALAMITIRRMGEAGESGVSIVLWFAVGSSFVAFSASLPVWIWPSAWQWLLLLGIGIVSALAQLLMTDAYRSGEPTLVAPFEYSGIIWTTLLGALIWAEAPDGWDGMGILILVGSGLYIWWREVQLGLKR